MGRDPKTSVLNGWGQAHDVPNLFVTDGSMMTSSSCVNPSITYMFVAIFPISIAFARRIWRRSAAAVATIPQDIIDRFTQIDQAVESIAVEVERIGEGQRFITRVLSEQGKRPALEAAVPEPRGGSKS